MKTGAEEKTEYMVVGKNGKICNWSTIRSRVAPNLSTRDLLSSYGKSSGDINNKIAEITSEPLEEKRPTRWRLDSPKKMEIEKPETALASHKSNFWVSMAEFVAQVAQLTTKSEVKPPISTSDLLGKWKTSQDTLSCYYKLNIISLLHQIRQSAAAALNFKIVNKYIPSE